MSGRKVAGAIRSLVNARGLQLDGSETMIRREKERSRIRDVQMDSFKRSVWHWENG